MDMVFRHVLRHGHDVERRLRFTAHRINVGKGVGCGDRAEGIGIIHDRREEIERLYDSDFIIDFIDRCIITFIKADEKVRILPDRKVIKELCELSRAHLRPAARAFRKFGQSDIIAMFFCHVCPL